MAECNPTDKSPTEGVDLTSISRLLDVLLGAFNLLRTPAIPIPPLLMLVGSKIRPGMSWRNAAARAISEFELETGVSMGDVYSDGPNVNAAKFKHTFKEMHAEITQNMVVQTSILPGSVQITGASPVGPIQGSNIQPITTTGGGY